MVSTNDDPEAREFDDTESDDRHVDDLVRYLYSIGQERLARKISDDRFAARVAYFDNEIRYHQIAEELHNLRIDRLVEDTAAIHSTAYDKASSYNTVILTLGYAGFFTTWTMVQNSLSDRQNAWVGLLLGASLLVFILWTLLTSVLTTKQLSERAKFLQKEFETQQEQLEFLVSLDSKIPKGLLRMQRVWPLVFGFTAASGLAAGTIVLLALIEQTVGLEMGGMISEVIGTVRGLWQ